jgi:hypothetical protein
VIGDSIIHHFTCSGCGYTADVAGGLSAGATRRTVTIACAVCKRLIDLVVNPAQREGAELEAPACPRLGQDSHATSLWEHPGTCPNCGAEMKRGPASALWDQI